ncbi:hypothetical protein N9W02_04120 [Flavobacteriaceae bacterium]|nr:hypothetical protein [Flavobacteriaceae bacterium]
MFQQRNLPFEEEWLRPLGANLLADLESDGIQVPRIVRNQGIRFGSAAAGQALTAAGGTVALSGAAARSQPYSKVTRYESVRKSQLRAKGLKPQKGVSYLPEKDSKVNRWHEKRLNRKAKTMRRPGLIRIRMGSTMMVAGRLLPVLAVGYLAYELLPEPRKEEILHTEYAGYSIHDRTIGYASDLYTGMTIGYAIGKGLLGVFS